MAVPGKYLLALALYSTLSFCSCTIYNMSMDGDACGKKQDLTAGDEANLMATESSPQRNCTSLVHVDDKCIGVRVKLVSLNLPCEVSLNLSGLWFDLRGHRHEEIKCNSQVAAVEWLFRGNTKEASTLKVQIKEALNSTPTFNFTVNVMCEKHEDHTVIIEDEYKDQQAKYESKVSMNRAEGIAVGVCLACLFLIILLITYCYYKNRPYRGSRHDYPSAKFKKGKGLSGFKAKFSLNRHKEGDTSPEKPKEEYRKKESPKHKENAPSHEMMPLVTAAAASATLDDSEVAEREPEKEKPKEDQEPMSTPEIKVEVPSPSYESAVSEPTVTISHDHDSGSGGGGGGSSSYGGGDSYGGGSSGGGGGGDSGGGGGDSGGGGGGSDD